MVLLCEEKTGLLQALAVKRVRILKDLAHALNGDVLSQYLLAALFKGGNIESICKLQDYKR